MSSPRIHPGAFRNIEDIAAHIARDSPMSANRVVQEVLDAIDSLARFPHRGHRRLDITRRDIRFIRVREYLIGYAPRANPLLVLAVIHGRRSPRVMAAILRDRA